MRSPSAMPRATAVLGFIQTGFLWYSSARYLTEAVRLWVWTLTLKVVRTSSSERLSREGSRL